MHLIGAFWAIFKRDFTRVQCIAFLARDGKIAPMLTRQIGANIRNARKTRGLSLQKLAAKMGETNWQTLQKLELAKTAISLEWIEKIASALETDPAELLAPDLLSRVKEQSTGQQAIRLDEQVATEAARTLATAALADPEPSWGSVQAVSEVLRELLLTFSEYPEAQSDVRVARPAIAAAGRRFAHEAQ